MADLAVLKAVYATWRPVPTRKVLQLVFEIPIEQTELAMKRLGVPTHETSTWCAIARLQNGPSLQAGDPGSQNDAANGVEKPHQHTQSEGPRQGLTESLPVHKGKRFSEIPPSQQIALKCKDERFQAWIFHIYPDMRDPEVEADVACDYIVKELLNVKSKAEADRNEFIAKHWQAMLTSYETETRYGVK